jgi:hypothetical protein
MHFAVDCLYLITLWMVTQNTRSNEYLRFMFYTGGLSSDCFNKNVNTAMNEYGLSLLNLASIPTILYVDAQVTYLLTYLRVLTYLLPYLLRDAESFLRS